MYLTMGQGWQQRKPVKEPAPGSARRSRGLHVARPEKLLWLVNTWALPMGLAFVVSLGPATALNLSLTRLDMERALAIGRRPSSDSIRAEFHRPYVLRVDGTTFDYVTVERIEVITEFRRLVLIAEQHAGLNDSFGRSGFREVDEALRPWRGRLSVVAYLRFETANRVIPVLPAVTLVLDGPRNVSPTDIRPTALPGAGTPPGERLEALFDATWVGQVSYDVVLRLKANELARVPVDFARLE